MINRVSFLIFSLVLSLTISFSQAQTVHIDSLRQKAEQGDADAQFILGASYYHGKGVPQDYVEAAKWWRKAAEQDQAYAQEYLGFAYSYGLGVPHDDVLAHMWYNLAASKLKGEARESAAKFRDLIAKRLTQEQIAEAQRLTREWAEKHRKQVPPKRRRL